MRGWGRGGACLLALFVVAGCARVGSEPPADLSVDPTEGPFPVREMPPISGKAIEIPGPHRQLDHPPLDFGEMDPILGSIVSEDARLLERVDHWTDFWTSRGGEHFQRYLIRMARYHELVDRELTDRGLPGSLRYLPVVESGYHPGAVSRVGATGLWQIMRPTAGHLGLQASSLVDERRDPVLSTRAALDYLQEMYLQFDSWFLALAAYNAGPGRISGILDRHGPSDESLHGDEVYLMVRAHLPAETREFVPRFLAAALLASDPESWGFELPLDPQVLAFDEVQVPDAVSLDVVARAAGVHEDEITDLNPHFLRGFTPAGRPSDVRVPLGRGDAFAEAFSLIPPEERISFMEHVVASGETPSHIARRYGVSVAELTDANGGLDPRRLQIGQTLVVPVGGGAGVSGASTMASNGASTHRVGPGDTWGGVAQRYGVSTANLARVNGRSTSDVIRVGEELQIPD